MKYGMRGHDFGAFEPEALCEKYIEKGIQTVQLAIPKAIPNVDSYFDVDDKQLARIADAFSKSGIEIAVLGCYIEPSLEDETERKKQVEIFKRGIYCANAVNAGCIGTETTNFNKDESLREAAFGRLCSSFEDMLNEAQKLDVCVAVEPVHWHTLNTTKLAARMLNIFENSGLKIIFDPVNLLRAQDIDVQAQRWNDCLEDVGEYIKALHIKDVNFNRQAGEFADCLLGEGVMEYGVIAEWLNKKAADLPLLREGIAWQTAEQDLNFMREKLK